MSSEYDDLADRAQRGELRALPGTTERGEPAAEAVRVALGRPRLGAESPSPALRVRVPAHLDAQIRALAADRHVPVSQVVREAVAAYVKAD